MNLKDFPEFLRTDANRVKKDDLNDALEGYVFEGADGCQLVLWTNKKQGGSCEPHSHEHPEYCIVISGKYTGFIDGEPVEVGPGEELYIPAGAVHYGGYTDDYRAIDGFAWKRVKRETEEQGGEENGNTF